MSWDAIKERLSGTHWFTREKYVEETQILPYYIGPLSSTKEWHAVQTGYYYGISPEYDQIPEEVFEEGTDLYHPDAAKEKHYAQQGYIIGTKYSHLTNKTGPIGWLAAIGMAAAFGFCGL